MNDAANAAQFAHWNEVAGPKWVGLGDAMELRLNNVNELLLARAAAVAGEAVLDVGCGTGSTTLPWAAAVGAAGSVLGIDISEPMLTIARRRVADRGAGNVTLLSADAQTERLPAGRFDLLASRFGVMFFADPVAAFHNLYSTLRRGGRLCFVCWDTLVRNPHWQVPLDIVVRRLGPPGAKPARAGADGVQRSRVCARHPRRRWFRSGRDPARGRQRHWLNASRRSGLGQHHGSGGRAA